jgi:hypothetical protein
MSAKLQLKARYSHIFTHLMPSGASLFSRLREENHSHVRAALERGDLLNPMELSALSTFPEIAYNLSAAILRAEHVLNQLFAYPEVLFHLLIADYELAAPAVENILVGEGEGENIFRLLMWAEREKQALLRPLEYYEDWLARDPFWAGTYLAKRPSDRLAAAVTAFAEKYHLEDAGAAYAYLLLHPDIEPPKLRRVLLKNAFYCFLTAMKYPGQLDAKALARDCLSPRWAYHLAVSPASIDLSLLKEVMYEDVGWLFEYYVDAGLTEMRENGAEISNGFRASLKLGKRCCTGAATAFVSRLADKFLKEKEAVPVN